MNSMSFKDRNRDFQEITRELFLLRQHNKNSTRSPERLLLIAEGCLTLTVLERFLRIVLSGKIEGGTLHTLLEKAVAEGIDIGATDLDSAVRAVANVRNTTLHGNYELAVKQLGLSSVGEYFESVYISEIEFIYNIFDEIVRQVDQETGMILKRTIDRGAEK